MRSNLGQADLAPWASVGNLQSHLCAAFDAPFECWRREAGKWSRSHSVAPAPGDVGTWLDALWRGTSLEPQVATLPNGQTWAAVRCRTESEPTVVAGQVPGDPRYLAGQLAAAALREARLAEACISQQELLDQYAVRLTDSYEELTFLRQLSQHVEFCDASRSLGDVADSVLPQLRQLMAVEGLCLISVAPEHSRERPRADRILQCTGKLAGNEEYWRQQIESLGPAASRVAVRNGWVDQAPAEVSGLARTRSWVLAPVTKDGTLFGWLLGVNKSPTPHVHFDPANSLGHDEIGTMEASLLEAAALMLGAHAANSRLFHERESLIGDVIHTLVGVIEAKDAYTCGHSDRVALIARRLGEELGLSAEESRSLFLSGLLHDIGKVGISDEVLLKPGKLTDAEFAEIKKHPEIGARLLQRLKPFEKLVPGVLHHHEAMDGSGYPHALKGNQIPLMARILAVADAFDAMTSDRPYRPGMPVSKAEAILREGASRQWDPLVVAAYHAAREDIARIAVHWHDHLEQLLGTGSAEHYALIPMGSSGPPPMAAPLIPDSLVAPTSTAISGI